MTLEAGWEMALQAKGRVTLEEERAIDPRRLRPPSPHRERGEGERVRVHEPHERNRNELAITLSPDPLP